MRVFITGATGFIGTALTKELRDHGHTVLGMSRSDAGDAALKAAGADVHRGSLEDLNSMKEGAAKADAVVHLAFNHDFTRYMQNCEDDRNAIDAIGEVLLGTKKPLLVTSGTAMARSEGGVSIEDIPAPPSSMVPRAASEEAALAFAAKGVNASIVRLPQVHDTTKFGLVSSLIAAAQTKGFLAYVGQGNQRWPAAHVSDVAVLYRLAVEKGESGAVYNAVGEEGVTHRQICDALAPRLNVPVRAITENEIADYFGPFAMFANLDLPASGEKTKKRLGWHPKGPGMVEDLKQFVPV